MLSGKTIVLGVTGSVAAYKMANMASMLIKRGCEVHVIMTENATNFINPIAFESPIQNVWWKLLTGIFNFMWRMCHWQRKQTPC